MVTVLTEVEEMSWERCAGAGLDMWRLKYLWNIWLEFDEYTDGLDRKEGRKNESNIEYIV